MVQQYFFQVCMGLRFLHSNCVTHSSLDTGAVMLGSCGMSVYVGGFDRTDSFPSSVQDRCLGRFGVGECKSPMCGAPPEVVFEQQVRLPISSRDMWSAGMILVDMYSPTSYWQTSDDNYVRELRAAVNAGVVPLLNELETLQPDLTHCKHWPRALNLAKVGGEIGVGWLVVGW
jgi:serine/threonine protein kinase